MIKKVIMSSALLYGTILFIPQNSIAKVVIHKKNNQQSKHYYKKNNHKEIIKKHDIHSKKVKVVQAKAVIKTSNSKIDKSHAIKINNPFKPYVNMYQAFILKQNKPSKEQNGLASYYGPGFWGHQTASGKIMRRNDMTVAHKTLPLGTKLRVTNKENGKSVIVTVNDRGPYVGSRIVDLAEKPAKMLDMKKHGVVNVKIVTLSIPNKNIMEVASYYSKSNKKHK